MARSKESFAKALVTTGLLTSAEFDAAKATTDVDLTEWIAGQGLLPAKVVNQALEGAALNLGRYEVIGRVGRGGMGAVLRAHDRSLKRDVAIKVLPQRAKEDDLERFRREAKVLATINHPNVVRIYAFEVVDGCAFLVMQLVDGPSLEKRLSEPPYLSEDEAWDLLAQSVDALANAEKHHVLHRDIKPGNILLDDDGEHVTYRLCDFGLARVQTEPMGKTTSAGFAMGTPAYMSPEQVKGEPLDSRSDMYGLGLTLYQALTGEIPFEGSGRKIAVILAARLHEDVFDVRSKRPEISAALAEFLLRLVARDRERRPESWEEIHRELLRRKKGLKDSAARSAVATADPATAPKKQPALLLAAAGLAVVVASLSLALSGALDPEPLEISSATPAPVPSAQPLTPTNTSEPSTPDVPPVTPTPPPKPKPIPPPPPVPVARPAHAAWKGRVTDEASYAAALRAAERGDAVAAYRLGQWLIANDEAIKGFDWLERGAATHPPAMVALGFAYTEGLGVIADPKRARAAFQRAADAKDPEGTYCLGLAVRESDPTRARGLFRWSGDLGDPRALLELARMQEQGLGGPRDVGAAMIGYRKLAEGNVALAMHRLGVLLIEGEGVDRDPAQAQEWFKRSADSIVASWTHLGELAAKRQAAAEAYGYFKRAAEGGDARGMYRLALAIHKGHGSKPDPAAAFAWMGKAARAGYPAAMGEYGTMLTLGLGVELGAGPDLKAGVEWYRKAAEAGDPWAMNNLALAYDFGQGVAQDDAQADAWYRKAAATGNELGRTNLAVWERLAKADINKDWKLAYPERLDRAVAVIRKKGGNAKTEAAVSAALDWLVRHQSEDGRWDADGWTAHCGAAPCKATQGGADLGGANYDVGVTSLALLAFLGQGHTHLSGPHKPWVRRGLRWLLGQQDERGAVGLGEKPGETTYNHALAAIVFCEAFALTGDRQLARPAERAIEACLAMRTKDSGWKYGYDSGKSDSSVTGWMVQALSAARDAGADVPHEAWAGAVSWFKSVTNSAGYTGYESSGGGSAFLKENRGRFNTEKTVMTAACLLSNTECGVRKRDPIFKKQVKLVQEHPPQSSAKSTSYYYWYYGSYALFQRGASAFRKWNKALKEVLLPAQVQGGCALGSWDPRGEWCLAGGRVYAVALNALTLEVYYRKPR